VVLFVLSAQYGAVQGFFMPILIIIGNQRLTVSLIVADFFSAKAISRESFAVSAVLILLSTSFLMQLMKSITSFTYPLTVG
jgi:hypothetical protein